MFRVRGQPIYIGCRQRASPAGSPYASQAAVCEFGIPVTNSRGRGMAGDDRSGKTDTYRSLQQLPAGPLPQPNPAVCRWPPSAADSSDTVCRGKPNMQQGLPATGDSWPHRGPSVGLPPRRPVEYVRLPRALRFTAGGEHRNPSRAGSWLPVGWCGLLCEIL